MIGVGENSGAIEPDFGRFTTRSQVRYPEHLDRIFALGRERGEVAALKAAKAERYASQRESVFCTETPGKLTGKRRIRQ